MADWFYGKDGTQHGPVSDQEMGSLLSSGQLDGSTIIWREGMADWLPLSQVPEFQSMAPQTAAPVAGGAAQAGPHTSPTQQTYAPSPQMYAAPATDGLSIAALVCGIMAIISCYVWGLFGLPAVICGHMSLKKINNSEVPLGGKGMAIAGLVCGYIGIALQVLMIIGIVFAIVSESSRY